MKCQSTSLYVCVRGSWMSCVIHIIQLNLYKSNQWILLQSVDSSQTMTTLYMMLLYSKLANAVNECACLTVFVSSVINWKLVLGVPCLLSHD